MYTASKTSQPRCDSLVCVSDEVGPGSGLSSWSRSLIGSPLVFSVYAAQYITKTWASQAPAENCLFAFCGAK
jgi:hypothetical protein